MNNNAIKIIFNGFHILALSCLFRVIIIFHKIVQFPLMSVFVLKILSVFLALIHATFVAINSIYSA